MEGLILRCHKCKAKNKIPLERLTEIPRCGKCKTPLKTDQIMYSKTFKVTDDTFSEMVTLSPLPVLLDFWAPWCGPCKMMTQIMDSLASEWRGKVRVAKLNVDDNKKTAARFQVTSVPTFIAFDCGNVTGKLAGAVPRSELQKLMRNFL